MAGEGGLSTRARSNDVTLITCHLLRSGEHCRCLSCYPFVIAQHLVWRCESVTSTHGAACHVAATSGNLSPTLGTIARFTRTKKEFQLSRQSAHAWAAATRSACLHAAARVLLA